MNDYQEFEQQVRAVMIRENTGSVLRIDIPQDVVTNFHPDETVKILERDHDGFIFQEFEVRVS